MTKFDALVRTAQSGDTIVYSVPAGRSENGIGENSQLRLAFVQSRPMGNRASPSTPSGSTDQTAAFYARDFLRTSLVGRGVTIEILYSIDGRDYGLVWLPDGVNVVELAAANGWVELRNDASRNDESGTSASVISAVEAAQSFAQSSQAGLWDESRTPISVVYKLDSPERFLASHKNSPIRAIVERVLAADRLIVRLLVGNEHYQVPCMVAGVRAPATARTDPETGAERPADPFGKEALAFADAALLQRTVEINLVAVSTHGVLIGRVIHAKKGDYSLHLLEAGLARVSDADSVSLGVRAMGELRRAEQVARTNRLAIFSTGDAGSRAGRTGTTAVVFQIVTADTLVVRNRDEKTRISLSSVRAPIMSDPAQAGWTAVAKDRLRALLIGKHVNLSIDGTRPGTDGYEDRQMATVSVGGENVAVRIVKEGLCQVVRHRLDDADRSPYYDELVEAQEQAKAAKVGIWSAGPARQAKMANLSENATVANRHVHRLSHSARLRGTVDYVINGSRFVVHLRDADGTCSSSLILLLSGVQTPRTGNAKTGERGERFGDDAREVANRRCLQRDVSFAVHSADKNGGFIGSLWINNDNFGRILVEQGLATVHQYSADKSGMGDELRAAQDRAQLARLNLWHNYDPEQGAAEAAAAAQAAETAALAVSAVSLSADAPGTAGNGDGSAARPTTFRNIIITSIDPESLRFKYQTMGTGIASLKTMMIAFESFHQTAAASTAGTPRIRTGELVSARFSYDSRWYRARIVRVDQEKKKAVVMYIDYGNCETLEWKDLRVLTEQFNTAKLAGQVQDGQFAFLTFPVERDDVFDWLNEAVLGRECKAIVEREVAPTSGKSAGMKTAHMTVLPSLDSAVTKLKESINAQLVDAGLAACTPEKRLARWESSQAAVVAMLRRLEDGARQARRGCWEYGEASLGDDDL